MPSETIVIIGGGAAGLAAAGALKHHGIDSVILDRSDNVGDIWRNRYARLHLHTIRGLSYMPYHKMPKDYPRYPSKDQFADYMSDYAKHFDLNIKHGIEVSNIEKTGNQWRIETKSGETWTAENVIIATGLNRVPFIPNWSGRDTFQGGFMHSSQYSTGKNFAGKRVLVVGCGNSGAEICVDLVEQKAAFVACSIRRFPTIVKRDVFGLFPIQVLGMVMSLLPGAVKDTIAQVTTRIEMGDLKPYGIKDPDWGIFKDSRIPMIDVGFIGLLKQGLINIRPNINGFTETGVTYEDNHEPENFDAVISATGYRTGLGNILQVNGVFDDKGYLTVECGEPTPHKGLWFIGYDNSPAGVLVTTRIQARKIGKYLAAERGIKV